MKVLISFLCVGLGGALGAMLRYAISCIPYRGSFPFLTLITNLLGAIVIGFIAGYAAKKDMSSNVLLFCKTGLCGGFTTFSTFSLEAYQLLDGGHILIAGIYIVLSVILCLIGIVFGMFLSQSIIK